MMTTEEKAERLADILKMRADRYKLREIGEKHGISRQRVLVIIQQHEKEQVAQNESEGS